MKTVFLLMFLGLFSSMAIADDWLEGGYVGSSNYGEIGKYFTDPIFYTKVPVSQPLSFYNPYYTNTYYGQPLYLGNYTTLGFPILSNMRLNLNPNYFLQSDFRKGRALAGMQWEPFQKNWSKTMDYMRTKSSFRIYPAQSLSTVYLGACLLNQAKSFYKHHLTAFYDQMT